MQGEFCKGGIFMTKANYTFSPMNSVNNRFSWKTKTSDKTFTLSKIKPGNINVKLKYLVNPTKRILKANHVPAEVSPELKEYYKSESLNEFLELANESEKTDFYKYTFFPAKKLLLK